MSHSVSLFASAGLVAAILAFATVWLVLTDPAGVADVADAVAKGSAMDVATLLGDAIIGVLRGLLRYL